MPDTDEPQSPGLAFDQNGRPWISYYDPGTAQYYLATNTQGNGSGIWSLYQFPVAPGGAAAALPAANNTAVAMYYSGGVSYPVMIVTDTSATTKIEAAVFNPFTANWQGGAMSIVTLGANRAAHLTADFDTKGDVVIGYQDLTLTQAMYATTKAESPGPHRLPFQRQRAAWAPRSKSIRRPKILR